MGRDEQIKIQSNKQNIYIYIKVKMTKWTVRKKNGLQNDTEKYISLNLRHLTQYCSKKDNLKPNT